VSTVAGAIALIWPAETFLVLSTIAGWLLLFYGIIDIVFAFSTRHLEGLWWMQLISGIIMVLLGFWAISPDDATVASYRGSVLLVVWVGVAACSAAGFAGTLSGDRPFTVFAPVNDAFAALPAGTVDTLLASENQAQLTSVLTYHVVPSTVLSSDLSDGMTVTTIQGSYEPPGTRRRRRGHPRSAAPL
jgi:Fasciclin domain/Short repeat of unknown function (DUF308)